MTAPAHISEHLTSAQQGQGEGLSEPESEAQQETGDTANIVGKKEDMDRRGDQKEKGEERRSEEHTSELQSR